MPRVSNETRTLMRLGAVTRLQQLDEERARILRAYPDLGRRTVSMAAANGHGRRRRHLSAAARARMSAGMKRYWAERKKAGAGKKPAA